MVHRVGVQKTRHRGPPMCVGILKMCHRFRATSVRVFIFKGVVPKDRGK